MSLFKKAEEKAPLKGSKETKTEVIVKDLDFHENLLRLAKVNIEMDKLKAESATLSGIIKETAIKEFAKLYTTIGKFTGSFNIRGTGSKGKKDASFLFIPTDRYTTIDKDRYEELSKKFGKNIVEKNIIYTMDTTLVEKYGDIISNLIEKCNKISDEDKEKLITATTTYTVKKGTISEISSIFPKQKIETVLSEIRPVYQIKSLKVSK